MVAHQEDSRYWYIPTFEGMSWNERVARALINAKTRTQVTCVQVAVAALSFFVSFRTFPRCHFANYATTRPHVKFTVSLGSQRIFLFISSFLTLLNFQLIIIIITIITIIIFSSATAFSGIRPSSFHLPGLAQDGLLLTRSPSSGSRHASSS